MKKILVLLGHPNKESFNAALAESYIEGANDSKAQVKYIKLSDLKFDLISKGYSKEQELEPDLKEVQEHIKWADHLVFVFPNWWGSMPALLKGFIDRVFIPGFAFKFEKRSFLPKRLLKGKTARLIVTLDGPPWLYRSLGFPGVRAVKYYTLLFCGVKPTRVTLVGSIRKSNSNKRKIWLEKINKLGKKNT